MASEVKRVEGSRAEINVVAKWEDIDRTYKDELNKYQKKAAIPGFRKGKVPLSVLQSKLGDEFFNEVCYVAMDEAMRKELEEVDAKLRPLPYARPEVVDAEKLMPFKKDADIEFTLRYDVLPEFELKNYKGIEVEYPNVVISDEMVNNEIERYRNQNAVVKKKENGIVENGDIVTLDYINLDSDSKDAKVEDFTMTVGKKQNYFKFDDEIIGMKDGETKEIIVAYTDDDDKPSGFKADTVKLNVSIKSVRVRELPVVDDEFAQDIKSEYKTVEDLKNGIRKQQQEELDGRMKDTKIKLLCEKILSDMNIDVPKSMVDVEINRAFSRLVRSYGTNEEGFINYLKQIGQTKESFTAPWRDDATTNLKYQLIIGKVQEIEDIKADEEKVKAVLEKEIPQDAKEDEKKRFEDIVNDRLSYEKTIDYLIDNNKMKPGKKEVKYEDYVSGKYLEDEEAEKKEKGEKKTKKSEKKEEEGDKS